MQNIQIRYIMSVDVAPFVDLRAGKSPTLDLLYFAVVATNCSYAQCSFVICNCSTAK